MNKRSIINIKTWFVLALVFSLINLSYQGYTYFFAEDEHAAEAEVLANESTEQMVSEIDALLSKVENNARKAARKIGGLPTVSNFDYENFCRLKASEMPNILGVTVSFEPGVYSAEQELYSVYYDKSVDAVSYTHLRAHET